jgi:hypothetical protein
MEYRSAKANLKAARKPANTSLKLSAELSRDTYELQSEQANRLDDMSGVNASAGQSFKATPLIV